MPGIKKFVLDAFLASTRKLRDDDIIESIIVKDGYVEFKGKTYIGTHEEEITMSIPMKEIKGETVEVIEADNYKTIIK